MNTKSNMCHKYHHHPCNGITAKSMKDSLLPTPFFILSIKLLLFLPKFLKTMIVAMI